MSSKQLEVSTDVYERLDAARGPDETVEDVIRRLLAASDDHPLFEIVGMLDEEELDRVHEEREQFRADVNGRLDDE